LKTITPKRICEDNTQATVDEIRSEIRTSLEEFDQLWVNFEQVGVRNLNLSFMFLN
jgi:hypothetical protein